MRTCRLTDASGRVCRRPETHRAHGQHGTACDVPSNLHHAFVPSRRAYAESNDDPMVRVSVYLRRSDMSHLMRTCGLGGVARRIRELIAKERGFRGSRLEQHVG